MARWFFKCLCLLALGAFFLARSPASAQDQDAWVSEMPAWAQVTSDLRGVDEIDTVSRQLAANDMLQRIAREMVGDRYAPGRFTAREDALIRSYGAGYQDLMAQVRTHAGALGNPFYERAGQRARELLEDPDFVRPFLDRYFSEAFRQRIATIFPLRGSATVPASGANSPAAGGVWGVAGLVLAIVAGLAVVAYALFRLSQRRAVAAAIVSTVVSQAIMIGLLAFFRTNPGICITQTSAWLVGAALAWLVFVNLLVWRQTGQFIDDLRQSEYGDANVFTAAAHTYAIVNLWWTVFYLNFFFVLLSVRVCSDGGEGAWSVADALSYTGAQFARGAFFDYLELFAGPVAAPPTDHLLLVNLSFAVSRATAAIATPFLLLLIVRALTGRNPIYLLFLGLPRRYQLTNFKQPIKMGAGVVVLQLAVLGYIGYALGHAVIYSRYPEAFQFDVANIQGLAIGAVIVSVVLLALTAVHVRAMSLYRAAGLNAAPVRTLLAMLLILFAALGCLSYLAEAAIVRDLPAMAGANVTRTAVLMTLQETLNGLLFDFPEVLGLRFVEVGAANLGETARSVFGFYRLVVGAGVIFVIAWFAEKRRAA
ncbi:MAG: hypothetical protein AB7J28_06165 [Hyphomonadaceae bacterium]